MLQLALPLQVEVEAVVIARVTRRKCAGSRPKPEQFAFWSSAFVLALLEVAQPTANAQVATPAIVVHVETKPSPRRRHPAIRGARPLNRAERAFKDELDRGPAHPPMPASRAECQAAGLGDTVPCPFVRCRYHLSIEVMGRGALRVIYPHWEDDAQDDAPTCALAEAGKGEHVASEMGHILGIGINRIGQIEASALAKVAARFGMSAEQLKRVLVAGKSRGC